MRGGWRLIVLLSVAAASGWMVWEQAPRLAREIGQGHRFRPAEAARITGVSCKVWWLSVASSCDIQVTRPGPGGGAAESFTLRDVRLGRVSTGPYTLLERDDDPAVLTTDLSLGAIGYRLAHVVLFGSLGLAMAAAAVQDIRRRIRGDG
jgi:hypothetical protein